MTPHIQYSFAPAQTDPSIIRCKTCRVSLPNNAWKNCENCRRKNAEISRRHRKSAELRKLRGITFSLQTGTMNLNSSTSSQHPTHIYRHNHEPNHGNPAGPSRLTNDQPRTTPASQILQAREYQWSNDLINALSALPPRSRFIGRFSVIADPAVNNSMRAHMFANELRANAIPISENSHATSLSGSSTSCALVFSCTCQEACRGRFIVAVDDDMSHPYGVPGQRIGAVMLHQDFPS